MVRETREVLILFASSELKVLKVRLFNDYT